MQRGSWTGILIVALAAAASPAWAQDVAQGEADAHFRRGNDLYKQSKWAEAEAAYEEAFRRTRAHDIAANLGYAELNQGKHREAAEHLSFAVRNWAPTGKEDKRRFAEERLALAKKEVGTLRIQVGVGEAEVLVDGARVGVSPLEGEVFVEAGAHTVEARRAGYQGARESVQVGKGEEREVALTPAAMPGGGVAPAVGAGNAAVSDAGGVTGAGGGTAGNPGGGEERHGFRRELVIAGGVVSGGALVAGVVLTLVANGKASEWRDMSNSEYCYGGDLSMVPDNCDEVHSLRQAAASFGNAAVWSFIGAGVVGGATLTYALLATRSREGSSERAVGVRVAPAVGATGGGVWVSGQW